MDGQWSLIEMMQRRADKAEKTEHENTSKGNGERRKRQEQG